MNKVVLMGRLTRDPEIRYSQGENSLCIARWSLAVDRRFKREGEQGADFINIVAFGKLAEHAEKYYRKGLKITVIGRIQTGSYTNKDGQKVYTTDVVAEELEFAESRSASEGNSYNGGSGYSGSTGNGGRNQAATQTDGDGFVPLPEGGDDELPWR